MKPASLPYSSIYNSRPNSARIDLEPDSTAWLHIGPRATFYGGACLGLEGTSIGAWRGPGHDAEADQVTGEDCFVAKIVVRDVDELRTVTERFQAFAATDVVIIQSSPVARRLTKL